VIDIIRAEEARTRKRAKKSNWILDKILAYLKLRVEMGFTTIKEPHED
jgi:hypothetical protein